RDVVAGGECRTGIAETDEHDDVCHAGGSGFAAPDESSRIHLKRPIEGKQSKKEMRAACGSPGCRTHTAPTTAWRGCLGRSGWPRNSLRSHAMSECGSVVE